MLAGMPKLCIWPLADGIHVDLISILFRWSLLLCRHSDSEQFMSAIYRRNERKWFCFWCMRFEILPLFFRIAELWAVQFAICRHSKLLSILLFVLLLLFVCSKSNNFPHSPLFAVKINLISKPLQCKAVKPHFNMLLCAIWRREIAVLRDYNQIHK